MLPRWFAALGTMAFFWLIGPGDVAPLPGQLASAQAGEGKMKFEIYQDTAKEYRWRLKGGDDKVLATGGQSFSAKAVCVKSVERMKSLGKQKFEVYQDKGKQYRWRLNATNGQVIASSGGAYATEAECEKAIDAIKKGAPKAEVIEEKAKD